MKGQIDGIGVHPRLRGRRRRTARRWSTEPYAPADVPRSARRDPRAASWLREPRRLRLRAIGHRVVHGGPDYAGPCASTQASWTGSTRSRRWRRCTSRNNLAPIRLAARARPGSAAGRLLRHRLPPRPCPRIADCYAIAARPLRRRRPALRLPRPLLRIHRRAPARGRARDRDGPRHRRPSRQRRLDVRAEATGSSVESTMGFTALDGLPMGTRPGQLDPGVVLLPDRAEGHDAPPR